MKKLLFLYSLLFFALAVHAQKQLPGGVQGVCLWNVSQNHTNNTAVWKSQLNGGKDSSMAIYGKNHPMNNNPALYFMGSIKNMETSFNLGKMQSFSLFTVCQETDTLAEQSIFCIETDTAADLVLTDKRMAALSSYKYSTYANKAQQMPRIYSYSQNKQKDTAYLNRRLRFGQTPRSQKLPLSALKGVVPEIILFNRYLSYKERLKVESYLALKYGISLNQEYPVPYLNSKSDIIWDADIHAAYSKNIAGIGRDNVSTLNQPVSESLQTPGLLKISATQELPDNSFIIWGDNNGELSFTERFNLPKCLGRDWKLATFNSANKQISTETNVLALSEINPLSPGETYWMMIDRSGLGTFPFGKTDYVKCEPMASPRGTIHFKSITADLDSSGADVFTLLAMPDIFTKTTVVNPKCASGASGKLQTEIIGGTAPFLLRVSGISNSGFSKVQTITSKTIVFDDIAQGGYLVQVTDANNQTYTEKVRATNHHSWERPVAENYNITEGETLTLDASHNMPANSYSYNWQTPQGEILASDKIDINAPGAYLLSVTDAAGCKSILEFSVKQTGKSNIEKAELFPNPATNGWFVTRINLKTASDLNIVVSDGSGKVVEQTTLNNNKYFWYNGSLNKPGIYFITITSLLSKETLKLIVQ